MPTAKPGPWLEQALQRGLIWPGPASPIEVRAPVLPPKPTEKQFQLTVLGLAQAHGWRAYHTFDSRRSAAGFPDLVLVRGPELIFAELKTDTGSVSVAQHEWLEALRQVPGVRVGLWRPTFWGAIRELLAGGGVA